MSNQKFVVPAAISLTAIAVFLFGFNSARRPPAPAVAVNPENQPVRFLQPELIPLDGESAGQTAAVPARSAMPAATDPDSVRPPSPDQFAQAVSLQPPDRAAIMKIPTRWAGPAENAGLTDGVDGLIDASRLDRPPRTRWQTPPSYPFEARRTGENGTVVVAFTVDRQGNVHDARIVSSTDRIFEEPTLRAVARWKFEPGRKNGQPVGFRLSVPVVFTVNSL